MSRLSKRFGAGILSQAVSSGSNIALGLLAAHSLSAVEFGAFAATYAVYLLVLGLTRALIFEATLVRTETSSESDEEVFGSGLLAAIVGTVIVVGLAVVAKDALSGPLLALACGLPPMLMLDAARFICFSHRRPARALGIDIAWALAMVLALFLTVGLSSPVSARSLILAWGLSAFAGALLATRWVSFSAPSLRWLRRSFPLGWRYAVEWSAGAGASQLALLGLGLVAGLTAVGGVRATQLLFGPLNVVFSGALLVLVPEAVDFDPAKLLRSSKVVSGVLSAVGIAMTMLFIVLLPATGDSVLGKSTSAAQQLLLPVGLAASLGGVLAGPLAGLRALRAARATVRLALFVAPIYLITTIGSGAVWGARGFAWGSVCSGVLAAAATWYTYIRVTKHTSHLATVTVSI